MKELQRKQMIKRMLYSWPSIALLAIVCFFLAKGAWGMVDKERQSAQRVSELEEKASALVLREERLQEGIRRLQTHEGIMEEIKGKFSVTREGQYVAIIIDDKPVATTSATSTVEWLKNSWGRLKNLWRDSGSGYNARNDK